MKIQVRPRVQKDKWSLYWRTSMSTVTEKHDDFTMDVKDSMTIAEVKAKVAEKMGWEPVEMLLRLEGFVEPWELAMQKGRELKDEDSLKTAAFSSKEPLICVRKVLVAEGWRIVTGGDSDDDSEDEEGDW